MNNKNPLVSIVIPFYNAGSFIGQCLECATNQSYYNLEIICVDDGSTDDGLDIVKSYADKDIRIKIISQENQYAGVARNKGLDIAGGEFITFWDADDIVHSSYLEKMLKQIITNGSDIVVCNCDGMDDTTEIRHDKLVQLLPKELRPKKDKFSWRDIPDHIFQLSNCWVWDKVYRTEFIKANNIRFQDTRILNDAFFCCKAAVLASSITVCEEILVTHRTSVSGSIESTSAKHYKCAYEMLNAVRETLIERGIFEEVKRSYMNLAAGVIAYYIAGNSDERSFIEAYDDYHKDKMEQFSFSNYGKEYFYSTHIYRLLNRFEKDTMLSFVLDQLKYSKDEAYREGLYVKNLENVFKIKDDIISKKKWYLRGDLVPMRSRVIIYGYGDVGKDYCQQIIDGNAIDLVCVIDKKYKDFSIDNIKVIALEDLGKYDYDYILISVLSEELAKNVADVLRQTGVESEKIIWADPCNRDQKRI